MKHEPLQVFIGYDPKEAIAYHVLAHSIMMNASRPVSITPLSLKNLDGVYMKERHPTQSTEFSMTRFLTPYFAGRNWSVFMDCDMLMRGDIYDLLEHASVTKAVQVVKHDYTPSSETKFLGQGQAVYEKKNWSSVMLFNGHHMRTQDLGPELVNTLSGLELHQFKWCEEEHVGEIPLEWNYLVGEYSHKDCENPQLVHYTIGGPYFNEYENCEYSEEWFDMYRKATNCDQLNHSKLRVSQR